MNWLSMFSGPVNALLRYGVATAMGAVVARGYVDGATAQTIGAGVVAAAAAAIGALTSTKAAAVSKIVADPAMTVQIQTQHGTTLVTDPAQVNSAMNDR